MAPTEAQALYRRLRGDLLRATHHHRTRAAHPGFATDIHRTHLDVCRRQLGALRQAWRRNRNARLAGQRSVLVYQQCCGLFESVARCDSTIGVDGNQQLVKVSSLADTSLFDAVANTDNWCKASVKRNHVALLLSSALFDGAVATTDFDGQIHG